MSDGQFHLFILALCVCSTLGVGIALFLGELLTRALDDAVARHRLRKAKAEYRRSIQKTAPGIRPMR